MDDGQPASVLDHSTLPIRLEVDTSSDNDSALGDDEAYSVTTSLSSTVKEFKHENGRRYHAFEDNAYFLPNDEMEAARLDLQHFTWKVLFDGGFGWAPYDENTRTVLDAGTGTGIWAIELAEAFPNLKVIGTDLSPIQPDFVPQNCEFIVDNVEHDWAFDTKFDVIHARMLCMGMHDWGRFFQQCWDALTPGGWLDCAETLFPPESVSDKVDASSPFIRWGEHCHEAAGRAGIDARASEKFTEQLKAIGFVNIERLDVQWPIGPWAKGKKNKTIGRLTYENTQHAVAAVGMSLFTRQLGWTKPAWDAFAEECLKDVDQNPYYYRMYVRDRILTTCSQTDQTQRRVLHRAQRPHAA